MLMFQRTPCKVTIDTCIATHRDRKWDDEACRIDAVIGPDVPHEPHAVVWHWLLAVHAAGAAVTAGARVSRHAFATALLDVQVAGALMQLNGCYQMVSKAATNRSAAGMAVCKHGVIIAEKWRWQICSCGVSSYCYCLAAGA